MIQWESKPIRNLGRVVTGKTPPKDNSEYFENGEELFVSPKDLDWNQFYVTETETVITKKALEKFKNQVLPKNAVMFTSLSFAFGKMGITSQKCLTNQQINSIIVNDKHDYKFVYYLLQTYRPIIFSYNSGIDTPIVPKSVFEGIEVKCPPLDIQQKIAAILSSYDELIENNQRRIAILEKMAEEIYREWFVRFRFPGYQSAEFEKGIPKGWNFKLIEELLKVNYGKNLPTKNLIENGRYPVYGAAKIIGAFNKKNVSKRTILTGCRGSVGGITISKKECFVTNNSFLLEEKKSTDFYWLYHYMKLRGFSDVIGGSAQPQITIEGISSVKFLTPPDNLRESFQNIIQPLFEQIFTLQEIIDNLKLTRSNLLPRLISGKLSVENLDIQFPPSMCEDGAA